MNKQILVAIGIVSAIVFVVVIFASISGKNNSLDTSQVQSSDTSGHHGSSVANEEKFRSLAGKEAPDFTLESYEGEQMNLKQLRGKKVILFFTEGLMCYPSCWNQMAAFAKDKAFNNSDTTTISIAVDRKEDWGQAIAKMPELVSAVVLFDTNRQVSSEYGVLALPSSMHRGQFPGHTYLIVDKEGIVRFIKDDPEMGVRNDELKAELDKLK
ncbi:MAG: Alkyl hydroperoxide reductase/ Thiol specific antioxidant/ Mal allergen [Microgenomates group bacterium GW2011_GWA2_37_6]|nr:MAG: Alkyl hydroperoxide reductase/ Thiol specific antioxidant/ Mal allergen [Microgenomates group bacterium GW2011_GWA2_37_6]